jgi:hypothetical protein
VRTLKNDEFRLLQDGEVEPIDCEIIMKNQQVFIGKLMLEKFEASYIKSNYIIFSDGKIKGDEDQTKDVEIYFESSNTLVAHKKDLWKITIPSNDKEIGKVEFTTNGLKGWFNHGNNKSNLAFTWLTNCSPITLYHRHFIDFFEVVIDETQIAVKKENKIVLITPTEFLGWMVLDPLTLAQTLDGVMERDIPIPRLEDPNVLFEEMRCAMSSKESMCAFLDTSGIKIN